MKEEEDCIHIQDDQTDRMEMEAEPKIPIPIGNTAFDVQFQLSAESLKDEPDAKCQLLRRINKFFEYNKTIQPGKQHLAPRREPAYHLANVEPVPNMLILFGSDFKKFKTFKQEYNTKEIYNIDGANCKMVFPNFQQAWNAILKNAKDPSELVKKIQGEDPPIPQCWFQMKPYIHLEKVINVQVRFATTDDLHIEPEKEALINTYKESKVIFNAQQSRLKDEERFGLELKKQKLELRKQRNSELLYNSYENQNKNQQWETGKNSNPGAHRTQQRQNSRSRSREKKSQNVKKSVNGENNDDVKSNYSYGLNKQFNKMSIGDNGPVPRQQQLDLSFDMQGGSTSNAIVNVQAADSNTGYKWTGSECSGNTRWSYRQYIKLHEKEEEEKRKKLIPVVIID